MSQSGNEFFFSTPQPSWSGLKVGVQKLFGLVALPKPAELERIAEQWHPCRSIAAWYVCRSLDVAKAKPKA